MTADQFLETDYQTVTVNAGIEKVKQYFTDDDYVLIANAPIVCVVL
jgi:hypothetical protein